MNELVKTAEAAAQLGVSKKTPLKWCADKRIRYIRYPGGEFRFRQSVIDLFLDRNTIRAVKAPPIASGKGSNCFVLTSGFWA